MTGKANSSEDEWFVYIVRCDDGSLYTGITNDLERRLEQHNAGTASRYTRSRLPVVLVYQESQSNRGVATKRELEIKALSRQEKEALIQPGANKGCDTMILRLSQKLNTKIKAGKLSEMPLNENPYADWSCHLFTAGRTQYVIMSNTASLYSCVMYGKGITDDSRFIERALRAIREFMEDDGQQFAYRKFITPESGTVQFAKAFNRSVTGSMNELIMSAQMYLVEDDMAPHEVGFKLNGILLSTLKNAEGQKYAEPRDAFKRLGSQLGEESGV